MKGKAGRIGSFAVAGLLVMVAIAVIPNATAYVVAPSSGQSNPCNGWGLNNYKANNVVQLCYSGNEAWYLSVFPGYAADVVIQVAQQKGMNIQRSRATISNEIKAHADGWIAGERVRSNPMDIEMYSAPWWSYILD